MLFLLALTMKRNMFFHISISRSFKFFLVTTTNENFWNYFFFSHPLHRSNIIKNSQGCCLHILRNIPFGSTNSFVKNIDKNSKNNNKSRQTKCLFLILWWLSQVNFENAWIFQNWKHIASILNSNSSFVMKHLPCCKSAFESALGIWGALVGSLSQWWTGRLFI